VRDFPECPSRDVSEEEATYALVCAGWVVAKLASEALSAWTELSRAKIELIRSRCAKEIGADGGVFVE